MLLKSSKIMAKHFEKEPAKEITTRLNRDLAMIRNIPLNMDLPIIAMLLLPKERASSTPTCRRTGCGDTFSVFHSLKQQFCSRWRCLGGPTLPSGQSKTFAIQGWDSHFDQPTISLYSWRNDQEATGGLKKYKRWTEKD
jgi:hypothetical protein